MADDLYGEYDELIKKTQAPAQLPASIYSAVDSSPEAEAGLVRLSQKTGIPVEGLRNDNGADARRLEQVKSVESLHEQAPATASWLTQPENARIAHDDIEALSALEKLARDGFGKQNFSTLGIASDNDTQAGKRAKTIGTAFVDALLASPEKVNQGLATTGTIAADFVEWSLQAFPDETGMRKRVADTARESADFWEKSAGGKMGKYAPQSAESYLQQAGSSIGTSLLAAPFGGGGQNSALAMFGLFADGGYQKMRDAGVSMPIAGALSVSNSAMEGLTEKIGLDKIYQGSGPVIKKAIGFVFGDLAGEEINALYNALVDKVTVAPDMTMKDVVQQVIDTAIVTSIAGPVQGASMSGAARVSEGLYSQYEKQQQAKSQYDFLLALGDSVKGTKTFARLPEKVQDLIKNIKQDGPIQDIYVPVDRFNELFQSQGMNPVQAAEQILSDPSRYHEAVATGVDVAIPLEEFAALADAPFYSELAKDSKTSMGGMTSREAEEFGANHEQNVNDILAQLAEEEVPNDEQYQTAFQRVYDDRYGQLIGLNQNPEEAHANATVQAKGLATLAARYGYDAEDLMNQFPLTITRGDLPGALQKQQGFSEQQQAAQLSAMLDNIRQGKGIGQGEIFGPSLGEFLRDKGINDDRGDLASMDVDKGLRFKKKMLRNDGLSLDKARELAVEQGYLPEGSTTNDLLDAIGEELRGAPKYATGNMNEKLFEQQRALEELAQWLDMMGVELSQTDNRKIIEMMQKAVSPIGDREMNQVLPEKITIEGVERWTVNSNGQPIARTEEGIRNFWKWFGESKVVDEDGNPLVVYHGSGVKGISVFDPNKTGSVQTSDWGKGIYFTPSEWLADGYRDTAAKAQSNIVQDAWDKFEQAAKDMGTDPMMMWLDLRANKITEAQYDELRGIENEWRAALKEVDQAKEGAVYPVYLKVKKPLYHTYEGMTDPYLAQQAIANGHDGIIVKSQDGDIEEIIVFDPSQIKSAIGNNGNFDPNDPNILHQGSAEGHEALSVRKTQAEGMLLTAVLQDGKVKVAGIGATHYDVHKDMAVTVPEDAQDANGFVTPSGEFLDRMAALSWLKENRPDVYKQLDKVTKKNGLESQDYAHAEGVTSDTDKAMNDYFARQFGATPGMLFQSAFHGSPHTFDKFSTQNIGTGEGAQAYGWGLYFAGNKEVAEYYRDNIRKENASELGRILKEHSPDAYSKLDKATRTNEFYGTGDGAIGYLIQNINSAGTHGALGEGWKSVSDAIKSMPGAGKLYQVDLAPAEDEYLLWDKPLSEQSEKVKAALFEMGFKESDKRDGGGIYHGVVQDSESPADASQYLHKWGIRGIKYLDGTSRGKGEGNFNYVIFREDDVTITKMEQKQKEMKRGFIRFADNIPGFEIGLLKDADASTFIHETGHYYFEVLGALANTEGAPEGLKKDYETLLKWLGAEEHSALTLEQKEQFARGFEAYLYEGQAPSQELRGVFQRFKVWLKAVYSSLKSLNVELTDDVRGVFDRLLATDEEISAAEKEQNVKPVFSTAKEAGMSEAVFQAYLKLAADAHESAKDLLEQSKLKELKRTHSAWYKEARAKMLTDVEAEAKENPVYEALHFLHTGKLYDGSEFSGESFKLSGDSLKKQFDEPTVKLIRKRLGNVYSKEGGLSVSVVAEMFGFSSADELIKKMVEAPKLKEYVKAETDRRMLEQFGEMNPAEIATEAVNAVHNDNQADLLREELKAIRRKQKEVKPFVDAAVKQEKAEREYERRWMEAEGKLVLAMERGAKQAEIDDLTASIRADKERARAARKMARETIPPVKFFKEAAQRHIAGLVVSEILPGKFGRAEAKASKEAFELNGKGDFEGAAKAKARQLLNHFLYREATAAREEADKISEYMRKLESGKAQARIGKAGQDYLEQVNGLLDQYEFRKVTYSELEARVNLLDWFERKSGELGFPPAVAESVLAEARQVNYRKLTMEKLRDVADSVKAIVHLASVEGKLLRDQDKRDIMELADEVAASIELNSKGRKARKPEKDLPQDQPGRYVENYFASHRKMSSLARQMDGGDGGAFWNLIIRPMNEAADKEAVMRAEAAGKLSAIFGVYTAIERTQMHKREFVPELDNSISKWGRIVVALNLGNEGNLQRLHSMYSGDQIKAITDSLDERDWQFVQSVWDLLESYWPLIEAKEKRVNGVAPAKVEAFPVPTRFGPLAGGYFPIKYDAEETAKAGAQTEAEIYQQMMGGAFTRATTRHGHTEARLEALDRPLTLSIDVVFQHLNQVIHDLTHHEMLYDVNRMLGTTQIQEAVRDHYGMEVYRVFTDGVRDVAVGDIPAQDAFEKFMSYTRVGISTAGLGWNLVTSLMQPLGLTQSISRIGVKWVGKGIGRWIGTPKSMVETAEWIYSVSDFMKTRAMTQTREIAEIRNQMTVGVIPHAVRDSFFYFIQQFQKVVDIPTWLGQYEKSMSEHGNEADAIAEADQAVIDSQASGQMKDLARIQRGGPLKKIFTTFYSFFSTTYNLAAESKARTDFKNPSEVGRFMVDMLLLYVVPVVLTTVLKESIQHGIGGGDDDEEKLMKKLMAEELSYVFGGFIGLREMGSLFSGFQGYEGPAGSRFYSEFSKLIKEAGQGEFDEGLYKRLNSVGGILFHYPATQIQRTVQGMIELSEGRGNMLSLLFGKPRK